MRRDKALWGEGSMAGQGRRTQRRDSLAPSSGAVVIVTVVAVGGHALGVCAGSWAEEDEVAVVAGVEAESLASGAFPETEDWAWGSSGGVPGSPSSAGQGGCCRGREEEAECLVGRECCCAFENRFSLFESAGECRPGNLEDPKTGSVEKASPHRSSPHLACPGAAPGASGPQGRSDWRNSLDRCT